MSGQNHEVKIVNRGKEDIQVQCTGEEARVIPAGGNAVMVDLQSDAVLSRITKAAVPGHSPAASGAQL